MTSREVKLCDGTMNLRNGRKQDFRSPVSLQNKKTMLRMSLTLPELESTPLSLRNRMAAALGSIVEVEEVDTNRQRRD